MHGVRLAGGCAGGCLDRCLGVLGAERGSWEAIAFGRGSALQSLGVSERAFPIILGPTAGGKSDLAVALARLLPGGGEVVTADAFQIYRGMDIGTAKPTMAERGGVAHHLIDLVEPTERFTVHQWMQLADETIAGVWARGATPIVVGGTNLYIKALLDGLFEGPEPDEELRERLRATPLVELRARLMEVDPEAAGRIDAMDVRRTVRALEVYMLTGVPISVHQRQWDAGPPRHRTALVILDWPVPEINRRINARVRRMFEMGLEAEVRGLVEGERLGPQAREALGYKQVLPYLARRASLDEVIERIKIDTRRFAKQQRTWLRRISTSTTAPVLRLECGGDAGTEDRVEDLARRAAEFVGGIG